MSDVNNFGEYSVKNVKSFMGMDTYGFNANLYRGTKKIAFCIDGGRGGEVMIQGLNVGERALLENHCRSLPQVVSHGITLTIDVGWFIEELVARFEAERDINKMRKQCQTKTLFKSSSDGHGQYRTIKSVCDDRMRNHIRSKYGNDVEIFNDVLAQGQIPSVFGNN